MFFEEFKLENDFIFQTKTGMFEEHELHIHDILEIHVLQHNEARFQLTHKQYDGKPGDVFLFRPFEPHWNLVKDPEKPIQWISILFSPSIVRLIPDGYKLLTPFYAMEAISPYIASDEECAQTIQTLASQAVNEEREKKPGWKSKQFIYLLDILIHILRHSLGSRPDQLNEQMDRSIIKAIEYVLMNFTQKIDMEQLVILTGKQRTFFYKKFKAVTGVTPNQFIHRLRMQAAVYLLSYTDKSVTDIAYECGYDTLQYFITHFRQHYGMSPRKYRKKRTML